MTSMFLIDRAKVNGKFDAGIAEVVQEVEQPLLLEFLKYVWEHKDDEL